MPRVRYAVVLNGGVSLAVWMGGVTHELNRIRLTSDALLSPASRAPRSEAWAKILTRCGRSAVVDILAGTSAGGLNGTLLATAVARGADLPYMRTEWSNVASLEVGKLTRPDDPTGATSVLDGDYFRGQVTEIVGKIKGPEGISVQDCTLLVTATALKSPPRHSYLEANRQLDVRDQLDTRDGRRVYKFERKRSACDPKIDEVNDFRPGSPVTATLVRAARASASFPVAFEPVWETKELIEKRTVPEPKSGSWLVDGGVLDNAPFEPLLDVLRERATDEPFERVVLYITPGVTAKGEDPQYDEPKDPLPIGQALKDVIAAMREPDERLDSDALHEIFDDMSYSKSQASFTIAQYLTGAGAFDATSFIGAAGAVFDRYLDSRVEATERWLVTVSGKPIVLQPPKGPPEDVGTIPGMPSSFPGIEGDWGWGLAAADRILRWWGRALTSLSDPKVSSFDPTPESAKLEMAMSKVAQSQREINDCWKLLRLAVSGTSKKPRELTDQVDAMRTAYDDALNATLAKAMNRAVKAIIDLKPELHRETLLKVSVAVEVLSGLFSWAGDDYDVPVFRYHRITPAAEVPPGITLTSPATNEDWPTKKLYGERLGHFGAFIDPVGREHDWLWGRLDGASELSKQLLNAAGVPEAEANRLREALTTEILTSEGKTAAVVASDANLVYAQTDAAMLDQMSRIDGGAAFTQLDATVWELAKQLETTGGVIRAVLAPTWNPTEISGLNRWVQLGLKLARRGAGKLRPALPKAISLWQKWKESKAKRSDGDPSTPIEA